MLQLRKYSGAFITEESALESRDIGFFDDGSDSSGALLIQADLKATSWLQLVIGSRYDWFFDYDSTFNSRLASIFDLSGLHDGIPIARVLVPELSCGRGW